MVHKHEVQGRIYRFKSKTTCLQLGVPEEEITMIPSRVRKNIVLVLDTVKGVRDYVEAMGIVTNATPSGTHIPISPTSRRPYPMQLQLRNNLDSQGKLILTRLPGRGDKYLRVDEKWRVNVLMLEGLEDEMGDEIRVGLKKRGGMGELRNFLTGWEAKRERERLAKEIEKEENVGSKGPEPVIGNAIEELKDRQVDFWMVVTGVIRWVLASLGRVLNPM